MTLEVSGLRLRRGTGIPPAGLDFSLPGSRTLHVRGPNGCGKTTLLRTLAGLTEADTGSVLWRGESTKGAWSQFHQAMLFLGHHPALKRSLTPHENLAYYRSQRGAGRLSVRAALDALAVSALAERPCGQLSAGQRQRVALARLLSEPARIWILDEPFASLDQSGTQRLGRMIERHTEDGGSAIVTAHHALPLPSESVGVLELSDA